MTARVPSASFAEPIARVHDEEWSGLTGSLAGLPEPEFIEKWTRLKAAEDVLRGATEDAYVAWEADDIHFN